ncbi:Chromosome partition protein Smc [Carpediemonas membranifera]|uniref:Chromosome partition protein Smc n=1 Tax=Carpediemonas membranifera TaxID=201153 RepID=A0A8J6AX42_9EUKA|nr:Chromosome partition protein Smc [Carpediemonas membranifera]|eukprot:KAG9396328.1 Chromosome partition protein Smc [Carpediemonas membranifera]
MASDGILHFADRLRHELDSLKLKIIERETEIQRLKQELMDRKIAANTDRRVQEEEHAQLIREKDEAHAAECAQYDEKIGQMKSTLERCLTQLESIKAENYEATSAFNTLKAKYQDMQKRQEEVILNSVKQRIQGERAKLRLETKELRLRYQEDATKKMQPFMAAAIDEEKQKHRKAVSELEARHQQELEELRASMAQQQSSMLVNVHREGDMTRQRAVEAEYRRMAGELQAKAAQHDEYVKKLRARHEADLEILRESHRRALDEEKERYDTMVEGEKAAHERTQLATQERFVDALEKERSNLRSALNDIRSGYAKESADYRAELVKQLEAKVSVVEEEAIAQIESQRDTWLASAVRPLVERWKAEEKQLRDDAALEARSARQALKAEKARYVSALETLEADREAEREALRKDRLGLKMKQQQAEETELQYAALQTELESHRRMLRDAKTQLNDRAEAMNDAEAEHKARLQALRRDYERENADLHARVGELETALTRAKAAAAEEAETAAAAWQKRAEEAEEETSQYKAQLEGLQEQVRGIEAAMGSLI